MNKRFNIAILIAIVIVGCNRRQNARADWSLDDEVIVCRRLLEDGRRVCKQEDFRSLKSNLVLRARNLAAGSERMAFADRCRDMVEGDELKVRDGNYQRFDVEVARFHEVSGVVFNILLDAGADKKELMEFFLTSMEKYRAACFAVSREARCNDESETEFFLRKSAAQNLRTRYQSDLNMIRKVIVPAHLKLFPKELHAEYLYRINGVFDGPIPVVGL